MLWDITSLRMSTFFRPVLGRNFRSGNCLFHYIGESCFQCQKIVLIIDNKNEEH